MFDEGYIKFHCKLESGDPPDVALVSELNAWRDRLYALNLLGAYSNGIGYGNISRRIQGDQFVITGAATGNLPKLGAEHYSIVTDFDLAGNRLTCRGAIQASSESLSHGAIYRLDPAINAVFHIHHFGIWKKLLRELPATPAHVNYGTPQMAEAITRLYQATDLCHRRIFAMTGHEEGIIAFGETPGDAGEVILGFYKMSTGL